MVSQKIDTICWIGARWFGIILFFALLISLDWQRTLNLFSEAKIGWLLLAGLLNLLFVLVKAVRWHCILRVQGINYNFGRAIRVYQAGTFFSLITPGRVGEVVKTSFLKRELGIPHRVGLASVIMDRLLDLFTLSCTAVVLVPMQNSSKEFLWSVILFCLLFLVITLVSFSRTSLSGVLAVLIVLPVVGNIFSKRKAVIEEAQQSLLSLWHPTLIVPVLYSFVAYLFVYIGGYFLSVGQQINLTLLECAYCIAVANVVALIPVTVSGIGTRDLSMIYLFSTLGLPREQAVFFSFGYLIISLIFASTPGAIFWFLESPRSRNALLALNSDGHAGAKHDPHA